ncbi:DUF5317 domain-containing protein [Paenibacillus sp. UMB7766-LJ446]|jgi:hypothetical protein|uniref:DUF5317 domain-containing protein n=1 Tax=Paenibacillus vandeheii TaxID=3035917 RepID=A0ABT8JEI9_9BACL|nr:MULTISPECIES: DUF5317 domain-containing protein [Paenibacillus]KAG3106602.1 hypothetical protein PC122_g273 [Phytophthora cactorum]KAG4252113.1 hypothetical protein PC116_g298 [Phytophthora cactorum]MDK8192889.1 DUF5317 domain-containing protein [Paenibacillus sp. UMB7766-LJ446]MDN4602579.1 DUF5317 domain-containing protein [Paenibacillus vandeheii]MDN8592968.1 DUF5317 domain-containing protein [Paenibacillus sp. 11B]
MVYDGILLGLIVGLFRGGFRYGLHQFAALKLRGGWIFPVLLLAQFFIFYLQERLDWVASINGYLFAAVYVTGLAFLWLNRHYKGFTLIWIGVFLNFIVMAVNGGRMPVSVDASAVLGPYYVDMLREGGAVSKHYMMDASTHLSFLGDIIPLSSPYPRTQVISIGDVVMNIGIFLFIQYMMVNRTGEALKPVNSIRPEEIRTDSKEGRSFP